MLNPMKTNSPTHDEIAARAHRIWQEQGEPSGYDVANWLEAEQQLTAAASSPATGGVKPPAPVATTETKSEFANRAKVETAAESAVEYHISPAVSDDEALKAALQKKEARAPKTPTHIAPKSKPAESGKPIWSLPHSS